MLRIIVLAALITLAGCGALQPPNTPTASPTTQSTTTTAEPGDMPPPPTRLHINHDANSTLNVTLINVTGGTERVAFRESYRPNRSVIVLDDRLGQDSTYRVVLRMNGDEIWQTTLTDHEGYALRVDDRGSVTVTKEIVV